MPFSMGSSQPRELLCSLLDRWILCHLCHLGSPLLHWQMNSLPPHHLVNSSLLAICPQEKIMLLTLCGWGGLKTVLKTAFLWFLYPSPASSAQSGY